MVSPVSLMKKGFQQLGFGITWNNTFVALRTVTGTMCHIRNNPITRNELKLSDSSTMIGSTKMCNFMDCM